MENVTLVGIDLSKEVFEFRCENKDSRLVKRGRTNQEGLGRLLGELRLGSVVAFESCGGSHYWARRCRTLGLQPKMMAPQHVKPYRKSQKNDRNDAEAICEASRRPHMLFVSEKGERELDIQSMHRVRSRLMRQYVAIMNQARAILLERGITMARGVKAFREGLLRELPTDRESPHALLLWCLWEEFNETATRLKVVTDALKRIARTDERCQKLQTLIGVGPIVATAMVSALSDPKAFKNGRGFAASLGLVPRQFSTAGKTSLGHITKRGDSYLRQLLVHGGRAALQALRRRAKSNSPHPLSLWAQGLYERCGANRAAVAMANKLARHIWAILAGKIPQEGRLLLAA